MIRVFLLLLCAARVFAGCDLLVQGAVDSELKPLLAALADKQEVRLAAWTFWTGRIGRKSVAISRTEMGPINAAAATALGIERFQPAVVINQGTAGGSNPDLRLWDIVVGERTTDYGAFAAEHGDAGTGADPARWKPLAHRLRLGDELVRFSSFAGDAALLEAALAMKNERGRVVKGNIGSAFQFNRELDRIQWLHRTYGIDSEDMESAYAAGVAAAMKTRFLAIRMISDSEWSHPKFEAAAAEYCAQFVVKLVERGAWK